MTLVILLHPCRVIAPEERLPPAAVVEIPLQRLAQPPREVARRGVVELACGLAIINGVAPVMPGPVADVGDQVDRLFSARGRRSRISGAQIRAIRQKLVRQST